jgi:hypothetical protein
MAVPGMQATTEFAEPPSLSPIPGETSNCIGDNGDGGEATATAESKKMRTIPWSCKCNTGNAATGGYDGNDDSDGACAAGGTFRLYFSLFSL